MSNPVIELYPREIQEISTERIAKDKKEHQELAKKLGLFRLDSAGAASIHECRDWCRAHEIEPLSDEDLAAWREYLPASYWSDKGKARPNASNELAQGFADYRFHEGVPLNVLRRMDTLNRLFNVLEIRTPEQPQRIVSDPVLWGHLIAPDGTRQIYPLARWAESDVNFISGIKDLKKILKARRGAIFKAPAIQDSYIYEALGTGALAWIVAWVISLAYPALPIDYVALGAVGLYAGCVAINVLSHFGRRRRLKKTDPQLVRFV